MKTCPKCKSEKPDTAFYKGHSYCKRCDREASKRSKIKKEQAVFAMVLDCIKSEDLEKI